MSAHAKLSPSGADGWWVCAGKIAAEEGLPDETSEYAAEGTAAHLISDECLSLGFEPFDFVGNRLKVDGFTIEIDEEMAEALQPGIDQIRDFKGVFFGEHLVDLSHVLGPDQFGTLDRAVVGPDLIVIGDLKFGRGVPVSPVDNKQLMLYALGFWWNVARHLTKATEFLVIIDQPRCSGGGGEWRFSLDQLLAFGEEAKVRAAAALVPNAPRTASEKGCLWCKRRSAPGGCDTFDAFNLALISMKFEDIDEADAICAPPPIERVLTPDRRSYLLRHAKMIEKWLDQLHTGCLDDALAGRPTPGLKAVQGRRPPRKWKDAEAAEGELTTLLGEDRFTRKLKSPTQVEKEVSDENWLLLDTHVDRGNPKPVLVSEADARPALLTAQSKFDEEEDE